MALGTKCQERGGERPRQQRSGPRSGAVGVFGRAQPRLCAPRSRQGQRAAGGQDLPGPARHVGTCPLGCGTSSSKQNLTDPTWSCRAFLLHMDGEQGVGGDVHHGCLGCSWALVLAPAQTWAQPAEKPSGSREQQLKALWTPTSQEPATPWATTPWALTASTSPAETQQTQQCRDQSSPSQLLSLPCLAPASSQGFDCPLQ